MGCGVVQPTSRVPGGTRPVEIMSAPSPMGNNGRKNEWDGEDGVKHDGETKDNGFVDAEHGGYKTELGTAE